MEDEIVINGQVYVRKNVNVSPPVAPPAPVPAAFAVQSIQEKLNSTKFGGVQNGIVGRDDRPDGAALSVQTIKQNLRHSTYTLESLKQTSLMKSRDR